MAHKIHVSRQLEEQLTVQEVADRLRVDRSTVWRWIRVGKIKRVRCLGRRITRVPASAVNEFLTEQEVVTV